jgi:hypothetical protein
MAVDSKIWDNTREGGCHNSTPALIKTPIRVVPIRDDQRSSGTMARKGAFTVWEETSSTAIATTILADFSLYRLNVTTTVMAIDRGIDRDQSNRKIITWRVTSNP